MKKLLLLLIFLPGILVAQKKGSNNSSASLDPCIDYGTIPDKAIPVCGTKVFFQSKVTDCSGPDINPTECPGAPFPSGRSYWYKFKCFQAGTLGFLLSPRSANPPLPPPATDFDFIVFDITGHNPNDVLTDHSLVLTLNGTGSVGTTGCGPTGSVLVECYTTPGNLINKMPDLITGHNYLLMVTNYTNNAAGYDLIFQDGTAVISDGVPPAIDHVDPGCSKLNVAFTTDIKCTSVTSSGSEFTINPGGIKPTSVTSNCTIGDLAITSLTINLATPLSAGNYTLTVNRGTEDGNTYLNVCDDSIAVNTTVNFTVTQPIGNFTLPPENCLNTVTNFVSTSDPLAGNTVTEYHWDFGDPGSGVNNTSTLQSPSHTFSTSGTFLVKHWIVNSLGCNSDTSIQMMTINKLPTAAFSFTAPRCETRVISFTDGSAANVGALDQWTWDFGDASPTSAVQNPSHVYANAGTYTVTLTVRNDKGCISNPVASTPIVIDNRPQAGFIIPEVCLNDSYAQFIDTSKLLGSAITNWNWDFGDPNANAGNPNTSTAQNPTHSYTVVGPYNVRLIVWNNVKNCRDTITQLLFINGSFPVANFNVNNPTTLCANEPVEITEASSVFPGFITRVEIYWDNVNAPLTFITDDLPFAGKIYSHLYPNFQSPLTKTFTIRYRAYSGSVCVNDKFSTITVNAAPVVQFTNMRDTCLLVSPFQLTQASEIGAVPGTGVYSGNGVSASGIFDPQAAGVGTHTITYTFTSTAAGCVDSKSNTITVLDTAHAAFSFVSPSCEQLPTSFTDISTAPPGVVMNNTVWNFGDLSPDESHAPGSTFGHLFPGPGTYTVTMYNQSAAGCKSTSTSRQVIITPNHAIALTTSNNIQTHCVNVPIQDIKYQLSGGATGVTVTGLPLGVSFSVDASNVLTITGTPITATPPVNPYFITTTGNTCVTAFASGIITVDPDHVISRSSGDSAQSVCLNTPIDAITYSLAGGATGIQIPVGLPAGITATLTGNTVTIFGTPTQTGTFNYSIQTAGNTCVKATAIGKIEVHPYPVPNFTVDRPSYCIPNAIVQFTNTSAMPDGTGMTYTWNFGEPSSAPNNTSTSLNPSHWYTSVGPFNVLLAVRSQAILNNNVIGCLHDTTIAITTIHPQPKADFFQSQPSACMDDVLTFIDKTDQSTGTTTEWHWDMGDGTKPDQIRFTHVYPDTLQYNISFYTVNIFGCNSDTIHRLFKVYPNPTVYAGEDKMILQGGKVTLNPVTTGVDLQYLWTPDTYLLNGNSTIKNAVAMGITDDIIYKLTVTARGGCKRNDDVYIKVLKPPVIPNTFTPNDDGVNDKWLISYLNDYPDCQVEVFTRAGQLVFKSSKGYRTPWDGKRNGKPLPVDTYYYVIEPGFGRDPVTGYITLMK